MPIELGIDYGARRFSKGLSEKKFLILEKERYKYMQALSDINGFDIKAHDNTIYGIIKSVRDWLVETVNLKKVDSPTKFGMILTNAIVLFMMRKWKTSLQRMKSILCQYLN